MDFRLSMYNSRVANGETFGPSECYGSVEITDKINYVSINVIHCGYFEYDRFPEL